MERLKDLYSEEKLQVKKKIDNAFAVALTIDFWTSRTVDSYLGVTFTDESQRMTTYLTPRSSVQITQFC